MDTLLSSKPQILHKLPQSAEGVLHKRRAQPESQSTLSGHSLIQWGVVPQCFLDFPDLTPLEEHRTVFVECASL